MQKFIVKITTADDTLLKDERLECFILGPNLPPDFCAGFAEAARNADKIVLTESSEDLMAYNLDGLILDLSNSQNIAADYRAAMKGLKNKFSGIICRCRRHETMLAAECEPDFMVFKAWSDGADKIKELTTWYDEMFLIRSALLPMDDQIAAAEYATDFVITDDIKYKIFVAKK